MMTFTVSQAYTGMYERDTGRPLPEEVEIGTLDDLMSWIEESGGSVVIDTAVRTIAKDKPHITVYNGYLE